MKKNTWTNEEIEFLKENYHKYGVEFCCKTIGYDIQKIRRMSHKLTLKIDKEVKKKYEGKPNSKCNINPENFYNITDDHVSYFLGLMWSDGFMNKTLRSYNFGVKINKNDMNNLIKYLNQIGKWNYFEQKKRKTNWLDTSSILTNNKRIYNFLKDNDFEDKSHKSPYKILSKIPCHLKPLFFRGVIDGDGCFYYKKNKTSTLKQFYVSSSYDQDWNYLENLFMELNITYNIKRIIRKNSSYSVIRITNKNGIKKIGEYIYTNYNINPIGLNRKYEKYLNIINF